MYTYKCKDSTINNVYVNGNDDSVEVYHADKNMPLKKFMTVSLKNNDTNDYSQLKFSKASLDIDITTVLFKYRTATSNIPLQMSNDFNTAIYAGWRFDNYYIAKERSPLGSTNRILDRGWDVGIFAGPGMSRIDPFSTNNAITNEYNGVVWQYGIAAFLETHLASFGLAFGYDYLISPDRNLWIYNNKPWLGFIVGIAID